MSLDLSHGVSRSGRVRKKSAKLKEMEEIEKTDTNVQSKQQFNSSSSSSNHQSPVLNGCLEKETPKKSKKLKIKFSLDDGNVEEMPIDNEIEQNDLNSFMKEQEHPTVPSLKIKLFHNSVGK